MSLILINNILYQSLILVPVHNQLNYCYVTYEYFRIPKSFDKRVRKIKEWWFKCGEKPRTHADFSYPMGTALYTTQYRCDIRGIYGGNFGMHALADARASGYWCVTSGGTHNCLCHHDVTSWYGVAKNTNDVIIWRHCDITGYVMTS